MNLNVPNDASMNVMGQKPIKIKIGSQDLRRDVGKDAYLVDPRTLNFNK